MYGLKLTVLLTILTLTISTSVNSETATSGNLLPNAGAGQSSYQNTTDAYAPDKVGSGQGFTIDSGIQAFQNELEAKGEGIVSDTGSLVGISTTTQSGNSFTTCYNLMHQLNFTLKAKGFSKCLESSFGMEVH